MMRLKSIRERLQASTSSPIKDISLTRSCTDADAELESFLACLETSEVRSITLSTHFLMGMDEENVSNFFNALGNRLPTLEDLVIQSSSRFHIELIPGAALLPLRNATSLRRLEFQDMQVTANHKPFIHGLAKTLENHRSLEVVVLSNFFANDYTNTGPNILDPLMHSFATMPALTSLELTGCGSQAMNGEFALMSTTALSGVIGNCKKLQTCQLSFLELEDEHFEMLVPELGQNTSLTNLALDYHNLKSAGFKSMMHAMEANTSIKSLSLRSLRDIGLDGFAQAMRMLQLNYTIESMSVTASPSQQAEIDLFLRMNGAGRSLLRDAEAPMNEWIEILARHSDDLDVIRHLLQEVPGLCDSAALVTSVRERRRSFLGSCAPHMGSNSNQRSCNPKHADVVTPATVSPASSVAASEQESHD